MLSFKHAEGRFDCRAAALLIEGNRVLLQRDERDDFWTLPGGRVEFGEPAARALARELREELREEIEVGALAWVVENFFTHAGERHHEIDLYFRASLRGKSRLLGSGGPFRGEDAAAPLVFEWHAVEALGGLNLLPKFLRRALADVPETTQHLTHNDEAAR